MTQHVMTRKQGLFSLLGLFLLFMLPYCLAWWAYTHASWRQQLSNYGELIQPLIAFDHLHVHNTQGEPIAFDNFQGRWTLLYVQSGACSVQCEQNLVQMRQIWLALGKDAGRVSRVLATTDETSQRLRSKLQADYAGTLHALIDETGLNALHQIDVGGLYIVDPDGHVMMHYEERFNAKGVFKDISRLLRISQIG